MRVISSFCLCVTVLLCLCVSLPCCQPVSISLSQDLNVYTVCHNDVGVLQHYDACRIWCTMVPRCVTPSGCLQDVSHSCVCVLHRCLCVYHICLVFHTWICHTMVWAYHTGVPVMPLCGTIWRTWWPIGQVWTCDTMIAGLTPPWFITLHPWARCSILIVFLHPNIKWVPVR